jgi:hypothetical protein
MIRVGVRENQVLELVWRTAKPACPEPAALASERRAAPMAAIVLTSPKSIGRKRGKISTKVVTPLLNVSSDPNEENDKDSSLQENKEPLRQIFTDTAIFRCWHFLRALWA